MEKIPTVYIVTNKRNGTLYTGVTSNLEGRIWEHKNKVNRTGFTCRYDLNRLVWFEYHETMGTAIDREKEIKKWRRAWKLRLIENSNPDWDDLYEQLMT